MGRKLEVPPTREEWQTQVSDHFPNENSPPTPSNVKWTGGSRIAHKQFLSLRTIWPDLRDGNSFAVDFEQELELELRTATDWLQLFPPFQAYLQSIKTDQATMCWDPSAPNEISDKALSLGIMQIARSQQSRLLKGISDGVADEQMVISSLVSLLEGVTDMCPHVRCRWTPKRERLTGDFGDKKLSVYVDGLLVSENGTPKVLLEAKKKSREKCEPEVCRQATGEFVALLKAASIPPSHERHSFMLSQTKDECFVLAFSFDEAYVRYIRHGAVPGRDEGILTVKRYGPYRLRNHEEVEWFARASLAIAIQSCPPPNLS